MKKIIFTTVLIFFGGLMVSNAKENIGGPGHREAKPKSMQAASCAVGEAQTDLDINNVRARILTSGDMWWDLISARYEVPKGSNIFSVFAGSLWIGGVDAGGQLKVAAMTYRQTGEDYWPGPIDPTSISTTAAVCAQFDKHWKITRKEVQDYVNWYCAPGNYPAYGTPPAVITTWPGNSPFGTGQPLAPFFDAVGDGHYDYTQGDYPYYNITTCHGKATQGCPPNAPGSCLPAVNYLYGDETLWWVFNDVGNIHSETGAQPIGVEIQAQAFAFQTGDDINNATFYQYTVINRSTYTVKDTWIGQWVDFDLGYPFDDYTGCDVSRGLGIGYNGNAYDPTSGGINGYGFNPPAVGCDFFRGPIADANDGIDNNRNCVIDEKCEQIIMSQFVYYNNDFSLQGNPTGGSQYYGYLKGLWRDGSHMTFGGSGYGGTTNCNFMFPGTTDKDGWGLGGTCANPVTVPLNWTENTAGDLPNDRRFLMSAGKFTLKPGAVNLITVGIPWARATSGGPLASVTLLEAASDKAQALFDGCFQVLNGPDAPDLTVRELDRELILSISYSSSINNMEFNYHEKDATIICDNTVTWGCDQYYHFQGYQIFQLASPTVTYADVFNSISGYNTNNGRLVAQCDIKDSLSQLINFYSDPTLNNAFVPQEMVNGANAGIVHTFKITTDAFTGNPLINHMPYYYTVIAYGCNNYKPYNPLDPNSLDGQKIPYFPGRLNVKTYSAIPHIPAPQNGGEILHSDYGIGPMITRVQGQGNGGMILQMTQQSVNEILTNTTNPNRSLNPVYQGGSGPVNVKVYDPITVPLNNFEIVIDDSANSIVSANSRWKLINLDTKDTVVSDTTLAIANEQLVPKWGLSLNISQVHGLSYELNSYSGFLSGTMTFADSTKAWLTGLVNQSGAGNPLNWIRAGTTHFCNGPNGSASQQQDWSATPTQNCPNPGFIDSAGNYGKIIGSTWAPYCLCDSVTFYMGNSNPTFGGPALSQGFASAATNAMTLNKLDSLASVDFIITSDKSKWTRCSIVEESDDHILAQGKVHKMCKRWHPSVDKNGNSNPLGNKSTDPNDPNYVDSMGMGWFPGYAINLETGERMNIIFGEDSWLIGQNGTDMLWNPTANTFDNTFSQALFGGRHYIYLMHGKTTQIGSNPYGYLDGIYDSGKYYDSLLNLIGPNYSNTNNNIVRVWREAMWVTIPLLVSGQQLLSTDVTIQLRVAKPYKPYDTALVAKVNNNNPIYTFNTNDIYNETYDGAAATSALDLINVVPNPYYAFSSYETNALTNTVYITNLPSNCTVTIYTLNGTLIRQFNRAVAQDNSLGTTVDQTNMETSLAWDLTNAQGIPISSGLYLIHIKSDMGERTLKWFGVVRPLDLNTF